MDDNGITHSDIVESPLLNNFVGGSVDYKGRPVIRSNRGCWRSAYIIIGVQVAEKFAYFGVISNLITYLTGPLGLSTAIAAANVNVWFGVTSLLPLVGGFIADAFLGRYQTIIISSLLYILALALLALTTLLPPDCENLIGASSCSHQLKVILFFISLYLLAIALGGHHPCLLAFGADQFDADNLEENKAKSSFFNWWYFGLCAGPTVGVAVLSYIQDNLSWGLGFGIPCIVKGFALFIFLLGTMTYRFRVKTKERSVLVKIRLLFVNAAWNWRSKRSEISTTEKFCGTSPYQDHQQFRLLNKALLSHNGTNEDGTISSIDELEEAKAVLRLLPIWVTCLGYAIEFSQIATLFTKQGATMDRSIGSGFLVPAAALQSVTGLSVIILIPIYDRIFVPLTRAITRRPSGITMLQRIGTGIFISIVAMVVAALVETKRLQTAHEYGLVEDIGATVPMKIWWLIPQYLLTGVGDVFTIVGMQEFFYDQMPGDLKGIGIALQLGIMGIGSFLSSFLILIVEKTTGGNCVDGWISNNMNQGHIDYFYYLLAGISTGSFVIYIFAAKTYVYN